MAAIFHGLAIQILIFNDLRKPVSFIEIILPFAVEKSGDGYVFNGNFKLNRKDYGIGGANIISSYLTGDIHVVAK